MVSESQKQTMKENVGLAIAALTNPVVIGIAVGLVISRLF